MLGYLLKTHWGIELKQSHMFIFTFAARTKNHVKLKLHNKLANKIMSSYFTLTHNCWFSTTLMYWLCLYVIVSPGLFLLIKLLRFLFEDRIICSQ